MPALVELEKYLRENNWLAGYQTALPEAQRVAEIIPLVHVCGKVGRTSFERLILDLPHEIPTSADPYYCSDVTRKAEALLDLPHSCYLYAGRAHPQYGSVALAFAAGCEAGREGSATPFDSGALVHPDLKKRLRLILAGGDDDANRRAFAQDSQVSLAEWRCEFGRFLAAYFHNSQSYWLEGPERADPEEVFMLNDKSEWVLWTFEIRFNSGLSIHDRIAWCADGFFMSQLRKLALDLPLPVPDSPPTPLQQFLGGPASLVALGSPDFCTEIEAWVRQYLSL